MAIGPVNPATAYANAAAQSGQPSRMGQAARPPQLAAAAEATPASGTGSKPAEGSRMPGPETQRPGVGPSPAIAPGVGAGPASMRLAEESAPPPRDPATEQTESMHASPPAAPLGNAVDLTI